jgi:predicted negative regulator of RcsB-dependent stress response
VAEHLTRRELKTDQFAVSAEHAADYLGLHRRQAVQIGGLVILVALLATGAYFWLDHAKTVRAAKLSAAMQVADTPVSGPTAQAPAVTFPTQQAKDAAETKAFTEITKEYPGTREAAVSNYTLGGVASEAGHDDEARRRFQAAADSGNKQYGSLAKLALAQMDFGENRPDEGKKLLQSLIDHPTDVVSKAQATVTLARMISRTHPMEARALLAPLLKEPGAVGQMASAAQGDIPAK